MKPFRDRSEAELAILAVLPSREQVVARLRRLAERGRLPVVCVVGKYNHGKSRLLNELVGEDAFCVADKRETLALSSREHGGARWLDAPGLDADVAAGDDGHAMQAAWLESDVRLFVHAVTEGELDASERALLTSLLADARRTRRQTILVLSQADQVVDEHQLAKISRAIEDQVPGAEGHAVSATRHRQGLGSGRALMTSRSGIPGLTIALQDAIELVPQARDHEVALLHAETKAELAKVTAERRASAADLAKRQQDQRRSFEHDMTAVLAKVAIAIQAMLDVPGPDHSLTPDSFANQFKVTAGKLERNRLQVGYSKACIAINAVLIKHGVTELPVAQQTSVRSLDSVMVAVMGVYVKYRKDLQRLFCSPAGLESLQRDFSHYLELSADQLELSADIADAGRALAAAERALEALAALETPLAIPA